MGLPTQSGFGPVAEAGADVKWAAIAGEPSDAVVGENRSDPEALNIENRWLPWFHDAEQ